MLLVEWHHLESEAGGGYGGDEQSNTLWMPSIQQGCAGRVLNEGHNIKDYTVSRLPAV